MNASESNCNCFVPVSTIFVFSTPQVQRAANAVYEAKKAKETAGIPYQFKSDYERMQYILGRQGRLCNPPTVGS
jgi:hypothetical protein